MSGFVLVLGGGMLPKGGLQPGGIPGGAWKPRGKKSHSKDIFILNT